MMAVKRSEREREREREISSWVVKFIHTATSGALRSGPEDATTKR
jgi:hypothetical protein